MVSFESDYIAGAHPAVLRRLAETNLECLPGYGADPYCERAAQKIRALCGSPAADVYFLTGGTQVNQIVQCNAPAVSRRAGGKDGACERP